MRISGINGEGKNQVYNNYCLAISMNEGIVNLEATGMEALPCISMPGFKVVLNDLKHKVQNLAKNKISNSDKIKIDLLIGSDYYFSFVKNQTIIYPH